MKPIKDTRSKFVSNIKLPDVKVASKSENLNKVISKQRFKNDTIVREESKPKLTTTSESIDFDKDRNYDNLSAGQKQTVINAQKRDGDVSTYSEKFDKLMSERGGSTISKGIAAVFGRKAAGLSSVVTKATNGKIKNFADTGNKSYDDDEKYLLYKTTLSNANKEENYKKSYGKTGEDYYKGSVKTILNNSKTNQIAGFNGQTSNSRNNHGELVIRDAYNFGKSNYKGGITDPYGTIRNKVGELYDSNNNEGDKNNTGKTYVTIPKSLEEKYKRRYQEELKGKVVDKKDAIFNATTDAIEKGYETVKNKSNSFIKSPDIDKTIAKFKRDKLLKDIQNKITNNK